VSSAAVADYYQVVVHVDEKSLRGGPGRADLPLETIKRLTCDGNLIALVEDDRGRPLALGRKRRVASPALRKVIVSRDGGCRFPGCHRRHYMDVHHILHWADGGTTDPTNLVLLCSYHHRLLHEGGFSVRFLDDGALEFRRADGRAIPRSGYRLEDMRDNAGGDAECDADCISDCDAALRDTERRNSDHVYPSMEGFRATNEHRSATQNGFTGPPAPERQSAAEVREEAATYRICAAA
jgi:hypothetical protein